MFRRKWLASVISVVMVFAFMPISSFALDDFGVQPAENTEVSVPDAEPAADSDTEATVEDEQAAEPAPVEETTEDVSEESEQQETESAEEVKDESDDSAKMPAQEFSGTASNGIKVSVSAPEGAFPEGTEMKLKAVGHDRAVSLLEGEAEDVVDANGVDITFFKDGREIQPQKAIKVSLSNANVEGETFNVYHVADNGAVDRVSGASSNGASFSASSFSIYLVTGSGESEQPYTVKYIFKNGDETVDTQIVKHGETLKKPEAPEKAGYKFTGWFNGDEEFTDFGQEMTVSKNSEVTLTAGFQEAHYVFFKHPDGGVYTTKEGVKGDVITTTDVVINISATSSAYKWYTDSACTEEVTSVTLENSNIYLYTKAESGHWITYDSNGGSFVA
ncbi:MAG: InlB B-repeat-containing protein, partial [Lentihominibacter sp.]